MVQTTKLFSCTERLLSHLCRARTTGKLNASAKGRMGDIVYFTSMGLSKVEGVIVSKTLRTPFYLAIAC